jgi:hypothetical protein
LAKRPNSSMEPARGRPQPGARAPRNPLARRRHAGCNSLLQGARSVAAAGAPRRSGRTRAACGSLKRRYSDRATARIHVSATRCVDQPSKASRSPKFNAALRARSLARTLLLAHRGRQRQGIRESVAQYARATASETAGGKSIMGRDQRRVSSARWLAPRDASSCLVGPATYRNHEDHHGYVVAE